MGCSLERIKHLGSKAPKTPPKTAATPQAGWWQRWRCHRYGSKIPKNPSNLQDYLQEPLKDNSLPLQGKVGELLNSAVCCLFFLTFPSHSRPNCCRVGRKSHPPVPSPGGGHRERDQGVTGHNTRMFQSSWDGRGSVVSPLWGC